MQAPTTQPSAPNPSGLLQLSEVQLFEIWRGQRFPEGALITRGGVPVRVISPGRAGRGPGPDFRNAAIAGPSGVTLRGDVELHVRSSMFRAHGHASDSAYANVVLHIVFEDDAGEDTPLPGGRTAPVVALGPWVARRADELRRWLERPLLWREPCHDSVMRMGLERVGEALDAEGGRRFEAKAKWFAQQTAGSGAEQALYEGLMEALGFGGNAAPMRSLACLLPWQRLAATPPKAWEAMLLGAAGLLPSQRGHRGPVEDHVLGLEAEFARARWKAMPASSWKLWGMRPQNHPVRRIAGAARLLNRLGAPSALFAAVDARTTSEATVPLLLNAEGFWVTRYDVCGGVCRMPAALVGRSRALEILANVVLPAAVAHGDAELAMKARTLFAKLPRPATYGVTRFIEIALASEGTRVPVGARRAQGLLALHRDWCTQNGCGRCPLSVDNSQETANSVAFLVMDGASVDPSQSDLNLLPTATADR